MPRRIEKWNYDPKINDPKGFTSRKIEQRTTRFGPIEDVQELEKTKEEKRIIRDINRAAKRVLKRLDLPPLEVPERAIHILSQEEFDEKLKEDTEFNAVFSDNHIYVPRQFDINLFIDYLAHEMSHELSYLRRILTVFPQKREKPKIKVDYKRLGFSNKYRDQKDFVGVNEVITELFAQAIKIEYCNIAQVKEETRERLTKISAYNPGFILMDKVFKLYDGKEGDEGYVQFMRGFITGNMSFMKRLHKYKKGSIEILRKMGGEKEDAVRAAEELGWPEVVEEIKAC